MSIYERHLEKNAANYAELSPTSFVERSAEVFRDTVSVIHGARRYTWSQTRERTARLASALRALGVGRGSTVSVMLSNTPEMIEAHYAVPAANAVLHCINIRLDAKLIAWQLEHCESAVLVTDREFSPTILEVLRMLGKSGARMPIVIDVCDSEFAGPGERVGSEEYEDLLRRHPPLPALALPRNEWDAIAVSYTSGTTGNPKAVVTHHRGAYLNAVCNAVTWSMPHFPVYLWTLPLFHCNGWCFPWTIAMLGGTHVCLRKVEAKAVFGAIREFGVSHFCGAPIVHSLLINAPEELRHGIDFGGGRRVRAMVAGAPPPESMIAGMSRIGIEITHVYGLTEVYGPAAVAAKLPGWEGQSHEQQARLNGRQGVRYELQEGLTVRDPVTMQETPADGKTLGEVMFRGNITMKGYLKNRKATDAAFAHGWFHTGDLAVLEPDRYVKIKDRSKDIIISGGENISSVEVEEAMFLHPDVVSCAVVAQEDPRWGEVPVAFVETKAGAKVTREDLIAHCRRHLAKFKAPKDVRFEPIPRTSTGKVQKFELRKRLKQASTSQ
jgi:fatty-acyl-CoA synthase